MYRQADYKMGRYVDSYKGGCVTLLRPKRLFTENLTAVFVKIKLAYKLVLVWIDHIS